MTNLVEKLEASGAVSALLTEHEIAAILRKRGWYAIQGLFYRDPQTSKSRELDVSAQMLWSSRHRKNGVMASVRVLIEAKSASGYQIVFAPNPGDAAFHYLKNAWMGDEASIDRLVRLLLDENVPSSAVKEFRVNYFMNISEEAPRPPQPDPPKALHRATAFKETNTSVEKDLEASVLWRAATTVLGALRAVADDEITSRLEDIRVRIRLDELYGYPQVPHMVEDLLPVLGYRQFYHPVVVIDARLFQLQPGGTLIEIDWCRFEERGESHHTRHWVDVVNRKHFPAFASALTRHYDTHLRRAGLRRSRPAA